MLRRVLLVVSVCVVVALVVGGVIAQHLVFGGTPTVQRPSASATSSVTSCATLTLSAGERGFALDSQHSTVGYEAHFLAAGQSVPGAVNGVTGFVTGGFIVSSNPNPAIHALTIKVDLRTLNSGSTDRDAHVRDDTFEASKYPYATFVVDQAPVVAGSYVDGQSVTFPLNGMLTMHGLTRPVTFSMGAMLKGDTLTGSGTAQVHITDFGMKQPQITSTVQITIANDITLSINFVAHASTCQSPS